MRFRRGWIELVAGVDPRFGRDLRCLGFGLRDDRRDARRRRPSRAAIAAPDCETSELARELGRCGLDADRDRRGVRVAQRGELDIEIATGERTRAHERTSDIDIAVRYSIRPDQVTTIYRQFRDETNFVSQFVTQDIRSTVRDAPNGFSTLDLECARKVLQMDKDVDRICHALFQKHLAENLPQGDTSSFDLMLMAQALERAGDHTTNLAEDLYSLIEGRSLRHMPKKRAAQ